MTSITATLTLPAAPCDSKGPTQEAVLILGARGRFGLAAVRAFANAGWHVLAQMRPGATVPTETANDKRITWLAMDLANSHALAQAAQGSVVVVHAINPAYTHKAWSTQALPLLDCAIAITQRIGATLMMPGNVYNFGPAMPSVLSEVTPQSAQTVKGKIRVAMEQSLQAADLRSIVIRAGDFFGSGEGTWFDTAIVKDIQQGKFVYPGHLDKATAWAYLPDLARAFVAVATQRSKLNRFEVIHFKGFSVTGQQWVDTLSVVAREQGWVKPDANVKFTRLPWAMIRLGSLFNPTWAALLEMKYLWDTPHTLDNRKLQALMGPEPHTALDEAVRQALIDLKLSAHTI